MNLENAVIVIESPNKRDKIAKITGAKVFATLGHFKELTKEIVKDTQSYEPLLEFKKEKINSIYNILKNVENKDVYIATDPDREGYAIGYLFYELCKSKKPKSIKRAEFFEITEQGIKKGIENSTPFLQSNTKEFEAWKARVVGDKLVGFILSPKYKNVFKENISVGRVQTPVLNYIVERQREIEKYQALPLKEKVDYKIKALCSKGNVEFSILNGNLYNDKEEALKIIANLPKIAKCYKIETKESKISPKPPFRTSQLQEFASKTLEITTEEAMKSAQKLFEKGLITYHRTDSNALSQSFLEELQSHLKNEEWYYKREYEAGNQSQAGAHEAIRITHFHNIKEIDSLAKENNLQDIEKELYKLIYQNTILSQSKDCINIITTTTFTINAMLFTLKTSKVKYKGFKGVFENNIEWNEDKEEAENLNIDFTENEEIEILGYETQEVKKKAPQAYKESNFIMLLEKNGIGRPSTYATFLPILLERGYITLEKKGKERIIIPTQKGISLIDTLKEKEQWITQAQFTSEMENVLDSITKGECSYLDFIKPLHQKMEFAKINALKPSIKQISYAKLLAEKQGLEIPSEIYEDFEVCTSFIEKLKKNEKPTPPSQKQIAFAEKIAKEQNLSLPKNINEDYKICSAFIDKYHKRKDK